MHIIRYPFKGRFSSEGIVTAWGIKEGDPVKKGDLLVQIEASGEWIELESGIEGALLKVLAGTGCLVRSGEPLAVIGKAGDDVSNVVAQLQQQKSAVAAKQSPKPVSKPKAKSTVSEKSAKPQKTKKEETMATQQTTGNPDNVIPIFYLNNI